MTRSASNVFHSTPMFDDIEIVREKPPIKDSFCRFCCRLMRWRRFPNDPNPNRYQSVCCGRVYFEIAKGANHE